MLFFYSKTKRTHEGIEQEMKREAIKQLVSIALCTGVLAIATFQFGVRPDEFFVPIIAYADESEPDLSPLNEASFVGQPLAVPENFTGITTLATRGNGTIRQMPSHSAFATTMPVSTDISISVPHCIWESHVSTEGTLAESFYDIVERHHDGTLTVKTNTGELVRIHLRNLYVEDVVTPLFSFQGPVVSYDSRNPAAGAGSDHNNTNGFRLTFTTLANHLYSRAWLPISPDSYRNPLRHYANPEEGLFYFQPFTMIASPGAIVNISRLNIDDIDIFFGSGFPHDIINDQLLSRVNSPEFPGMQDPRECMLRNMFSNAHLNGITHIQEIRDTEITRNLGDFMVGDFGQLELMGLEPGFYVITLLEPPLGFTTNQFPLRDNAFNGGGLICPSVRTDNQGRPIAFAWVVEGGMIHSQDFQLTVDPQWNTHRFRGWQYPHGWQYQ